MDKDNVEIVDSLQNDWTVQRIWNDTLSIDNKRELKPRKRIWASELGKNHYERFLKMTAVEPDLEYSKRVLRVFSAGELFERLVGYSLMISGLLRKDNEKHMYYLHNDYLPISVKPDFVAGGKVSLDEALEKIDNDPFLNFIEENESTGSGIIEKMKTIAINMCKHVEEQYPDGLRPLVYEVKSVNSLLFWAKKHYLKDAYPHHKKQLYAGMLATGIEEGRLLYISKDDLTIAEFPVYLNDEELRAEIEEDVRQMTEYINLNEEPPKPEYIVFDERKPLSFQWNKKRHKLKGSYTANWEIKRSNYITKITGFETADEWEDSIKKQIKELNEKLKDDYKANYTE